MRLAGYRAGGRFLPNELRDRRIGVRKSGDGG